MTKRETKIKEKQKPLSTTACTKKSVFVDTNRFRNGCFCTNMCKACTCFKVDLITTPVGALKIIELVREFFRQKLIITGDVVFSYEKIFVMTIVSDIFL